MKLRKISISVDAYRILVEAKLSRRESFTGVVRRATWDEPATTMGEALRLLKKDFRAGKFMVTEEELELSRSLRQRRKIR